MASVTTCYLSLLVSLRQGASRAEALGRAITYNVPIYGTPTTPREDGRHPTLKAGIPGRSIPKGHKDVSSVIPLAYSVPLANGMTDKTSLRTISEKACETECITGLHSA